MLEGVRPIGDRVLIKPDEPETETASGLVLVKSEFSYDDVPVSGIVVALAIGPRCPTCGGTLRQDLAVGDHVVFSPNVGANVTIDGAQYVTLAESDILAKVED